MGRPKIIRTCKECGASFWGKPQPFCSQKCWKKNHDGPIEARFWSKVDKRGPFECWPWLASTLRHGHGDFSVNGKRVLAHRFSWSLVNGPIPVGEKIHDCCILHSCDNPPCVNPSHLRLGNQADNVRDRDTRNRFRKMIGEENGASKLTVAHASEILFSPERGVDLARRFSVSPATVSAIRQRRNWAHLS